MHPYKATGHEISLEAKKGKLVKRKLINGTGKEFGGQSFCDCPFCQRALV